MTDTDYCANILNFTEQTDTKFTMKIPKKLLPALLLVVAVLPAFADNVPKQRAEQAAQAFFGTRAHRLANVSAGTSHAGTISEADFDSPAMAVYNRAGGGFVVVALNDAAPPILAWSPDGSFPARGDMPEGMAWWFSSLEAQLETLGEGAQATEQVRRMWEDVSSQSSLRGTGKLYETANWGQHEPFNNFCPALGGQRCLTGCVATAGSIIARYFGWPDAGVGTIPAKPSGVSGPDYPAHDLGYAYDWDNMPLSYGASYTTAQADAVATLMYDMGTMAAMSYGTSASSSSTSDLLAGLKQYMKYDKGAYQADRSEYSDEQWKNLLTRILDDYGPTIYRAQDPSLGGHSYVMDGYDGAGRFHFNWGWGFANCYCTVDAMIPEGTPYNFSERHQVIVGLVPDYEGTSTDRDWLTYTANGSNTGISTTAETFSEGTVFTCRAGWLGPKLCAFSGTLIFALYDKNYNFKQDISLGGGYSTSLALKQMTVFTQSCRITATIAPGDRIMVRYIGQHNEGVINSGAGCVTEIIVMEDDGGGDPDPDPTEGYTAAETAASTSLAYSRASGILTLGFANPANWAVKNASGVTLDGGVVSVAGNVDIDLSGYAPGVYTISIGSPEDPFSFTVTK